MLNKRAQKLVNNLYQAGFDDDHIRERLSVGGYTASEIEGYVQVKQNHEWQFKCHWLLSIWLGIHIIVVIPSILLLVFMLLASIADGIGWGVLIFGYLLFDACTQLWLMNKLRQNKIIGYYGLMILFAIRFFLVPVVNLLDAILLSIGVYGSYYKADARKSKPKRNVTA